MRFINEFLPSAIFNSYIPYSSPCARKDLVMNNEPRIKTPKEVAQQVRDLLEKDQAAIISCDIYANVLTVKAHLWSLPQLERFIKVAKEMGLIIEGDIEKIKLVLVLKAILNRRGVVR